MSTYKEQAAFMNTHHAPHTESRKTLVVILSMHRSGSSLTADILQRLGLSLGPFPLLGPTPANPYGHFESMPFFRINMKLQNKCFQFIEDVPETAEGLERFLATQGQCDDLPWASADVEQGETTVAQLTADRPISGFKDPRTALLWPFWSRVFKRVANLRVLPVLVLRSPHEIAMSIFTRAQGRFAYQDILSVIEVHFERMRWIRDAWHGDVALVRFGEEHFETDLEKTAELCGFRWNAQVFAAAYDRNVTHRRPARIGHRVQQVYESLAGLDATGTVDDVRRVERDAAEREAILRRRLGETAADLHLMQRQLYRAQAQLEEIRQQMAGKKAA